MTQKFAVGDKVRVKYATYICTDDSVGKTLEIKSINNDVYTYLSDGLNHRLEALELVETVRKFAVGDYVKVTGSSVTGCTDPIGKIYRIKGLDTNWDEFPRAYSVYPVCGSGGGYSIDEANLELVDPMVEIYIGSEKFEVPRFKLDQITKIIEG